MSDQRFLDNHLKQLGQAFESLGDAVTIVDTDDRLVFVNSASETLYGYSKEELLGRPISIIVSDGYFPVTTEMVRSAPAARWAGEITILRKGGEEFPAHLTVTLQKDQNGKVIGQICLIRDLTQLRRAEEAAARLASEQTILAEIGRVISSSTDINTAYDGFANEVRGLIPFDRITIDLHDAKRDTFSLAYMAGLDVPNRRHGDVNSFVSVVTDEVRRTK